MTGASEYNKADVQAFGASIEELVNAVRDDGVGAGDLDELIQTMTAAAQSVNEMKAVPAAAGLHIIGTAAVKFGDRLLAEAIAAEATEGGPA